MSQAAAATTRDDTHPPTHPHPTPPSAHLFCDPSSFLRVTSVSSSDTLQILKGGAASILYA